MGTRIEIGVGLMVTALGSLGVFAGIGASIALLVIGGILILHASYDWVKSQREKKSMTTPGSQHFHVESHGQQGGITAAIVNIQGDLGPKVQASDIVHTEVSDGKHRYESVLTVDSHYSVPAVRVTAYADSIQSLDVVPQRSGMHTFGHMGKRDGYHFTTIQNASGQYRIRVITSQPEQVKIDVG